MRNFPLLVILLTLIAPAVAQEAVVREERQSYRGSFTAFAVMYCAEPALRFGSACFALDGTEETVSLEVRDVTGLTVPFLVLFEDASAESRSVCASHVEDLPIPEGATHVEVMVWGAPWTPFACPGMSVGSGVAGEVVARFG